MNVAQRNAGKTHCVRGHPLSGENLRIDAGGRRRCRTCERIRREANKPVERCACGNDKTPGARTCWDCYNADHRHQHDPEVKAEALRLVRLGLSERAIGRNLEVPEGTVRAWVKESRKGELPSGDTCDECGEALVAPAELCGWCAEEREGGVPMPDLSWMEAVAA